MTVAKTFLVIACAAVLSFGVSTTHVAHALVEVMICPDSSQSNIMITSPQSDSIVNEPKLSISGDVTYISQIDFFIDDVYSHTVALGYSATEFSSPVSLMPGTHTIKLTATDSCSQAMYADSVVVTYEPTTQPSVGENVETIVEGSSSRVNTEAQPALENSTIETFITNFIVPPFAKITDALDISSPDAVGRELAPADVTRSMLFVAGTALTFAAVHIGIVATLPAHFSFLLNHRRWSSGVLAIAGLALMSLVFMA